MTARANNGTKADIAALKARLESHERQCIERHERNDRDHDALFKKIDKFRADAVNRWNALHFKLIAVLWSVIGTLVGFVVYLFKTFGAFG